MIVEFGTENSYNVLKMMPNTPSLIKLFVQFYYCHSNNLMFYHLNTMHKLNYWKYIAEYKLTSHEQGFVIKEHRNSYKFNCSSLS